MSFAVEVFVLLLCIISIQSSRPIQIENNDKKIQFSWTISKVPNNIYTYIKIIHLNLWNFSYFVHI